MPKSISISFPTCGKIFPNKIDKMWGPSIALADKYLIFSNGKIYKILSRPDLIKRRNNYIQKFE